MWPPNALIREAVEKFYLMQGRLPDQLVMSPATRDMVWGRPNQISIYRFDGLKIMLDYECPFGMMYVTNQYDQWSRDKKRDIMSGKEK